jgi:hypothetical protein
MFVYGSEQPNPKPPELEPVLVPTETIVDKFKSVINKIRGQDV